MMHKIFMVAGIVGATIVALLLGTVTMPIVIDAANSANTTISAFSNMTAYPGLSAGLTGSPLWMYFFIPTLGIVLIVLALRERNV